MPMRNFPPGKSQRAPIIVEPCSGGGPAKSQSDRPISDPPLLSLDSLRLKSQNYSDRDATPERSVLHSTYCRTPLSVSWCQSDACRTKGVPSMCDYSLHNVATRPAQIEDKLVTTKFRKSITRGFAAVGDLNVAVCLMPGTEIAFDEKVESAPSFAFA